MKMKTYTKSMFVAAFLLLSTVLPIRANEGMWLLMLLKQNEKEMKKAGLKLSADQIYSLNKSSLKDAMVGLNGGNPMGNFCTAEVVSSQGLLFTNHHCAYDGIQSHSTTQNDYLTDGFWAKTMKDELPVAGVAASFLVRMENVSDRVKAALKDVPEPQRAAAARKVMTEIAEEAKKGTHYDAFVRDYFRGNEYYLFVMETFKDVRLVGAPPSAIGKFGGDTDNWMWPRHTGDFAMLRIYAGKDGKPAAYSADNVPMKPRHVLPISMNGVKPEDFTMVMGFPGRTDRYKVSFGIQNDLEQINPARIKLREKRLALMKEDMDTDPAIRIKYASKYASISNYYKYFIGQNAGLKRLKTIPFKQSEEKIFQAWADGNANADTKGALKELETAYKGLRDYNLSQTYLNEAAFAPEVITLAAQFRDFAAAVKGGEQQTTAMVERIKEAAKDMFKDYNVATDKKIFAALMGMYYKDVAKEQHPDIFKTVESEFGGDMGKFADALYASSFMTSEDKVNEFLKTPSVETLEKDWAFKAYSSIFKNFTENIAPKTAPLNLQVERNMRFFIAGLRDMKKGQLFYPDANSTLRLSYGNVRAYKGRDAVQYSHYTTMEGIMEKEDATNEEFIVPAKLSQLYASKDYGIYADKNGQLPVAFITDNDITGGNSGSPVINGKGELVGIAFDGNWEAMTGDFVFDKELKRCINVDIRFVLFVIDKYAGAGHLVKEMNLVK